MKVNDSIEEEEVDFTEEIMALADDEQMAQEQKAVRQSDELLPEVVQKSETDNVEPGKPTESTEETSEEREEPSEEVNEVEESSESLEDRDSEADGETSDSSESESEDEVDSRDEQIVALRAALNAGGMAISTEVEREESIPVPSEEIKRETSNPEPIQEMLPFEIKAEDLSEEDKDKMISGDFSPLLSKINEGIREATAFNAMQMAQVVGPMVDSHNAVAKSINEYWDRPENADLSELRAFVTKVAAELDDPSLTVTEVLTKAGDQVRTQLKIGAAKAKQKKQATRAPHFAGKTARRSNTADVKAKPELTPAEQDLLEFLEPIE